MGAATAIRFAQSGASVIIVGRSEEAAEKVLEQCRLSARPGVSSFHFVKADLSLVSGVKQAVRDIESKAPDGIDYLVETQVRWRYSPSGAANASA
jgi:NAD(P)-dependent dehydrogenase (short-subunit alcohol dehydrogenase family)